MSNPGIVLLSIALFTSGCGGLSSSSLAAARPGLSSPRVTRYARIIDEALDAYENELEAAADHRYGSRSEAVAKARELGEESRLLGHIDRTLHADGLTVRDLCAFAKDNEAFVDWQQALYAERAPALERLVDAVADAPIRPQREPDPSWEDIESAGQLTAAR